MKNSLSFGFLLGSFFLTTGEKLSASQDLFKIKSSPEISIKKLIHEDIRNNNIHNNNNQNNDNNHNNNVHNNNNQNNDNNQNDNQKIDHHLPNQINQNQAAENPVAQELGPQDHINNNFLSPRKRNQFFELSYALMAENTKTDNFRTIFKNMADAIRGINSPILKNILLVKDIPDIIFKLIGLIGYDKSLSLKTMNAKVQFQHINKNFCALMICLSTSDYLQKLLNEENLKGENKNLHDVALILTKQRKNNENIASLSKSLYGKRGWLRGASGRIFEAKWYNTLSEEEKQMLIHIVVYGSKFANEKEAFRQSSALRAFSDLHNPLEKPISERRNKIGRFFGKLFWGTDSLVDETINPEKAYIKR